MERTQRLIFLAVAIGWTIFRLVRYVRLANSRRAAIPTPTRPPASSQSPIEPAGRAAGGRAGNLAAVGIFVAGNAVIWPVLFVVPALEDMPTIWRLAAGVLANLVLISVASAAAARMANRSQPGADDDRNPIK